MGACQAGWHKNHARPILPSSSSSSSKPHATRPCKRLSEIIFSVHLSPGSQQFCRSPILSQGLTKPHLRTVSRRSLLFSFLGLPSRTASFPPKPGRLVDGAQQSNAIPSRNRAHHSRNGRTRRCARSGRHPPGRCPNRLHEATRWPNFPLSHLGR